MKALRATLAVFAEHGKAYLCLNVAFYGALVLSMVVATVVPSLHANALADVDRQLSQPGLGQAVSGAYEGGHPVSAIAVTFAVNLVASVVLTTLPSFAVPFLGLAMVIVRVVTWGFLFPPVGPDAIGLAPHYVTLLIEGQANVLAAFAVYVHGRRWLWPRAHGLGSHRAGYLSGAHATAGLYLLVGAVFLIGACYEALELLYLVPLLR